MMASSRSSPIPVPYSHTSSNVSAPPQNQTMLQGFEWYVPANNKHWTRLEAAVPMLAKLGVTTLWIPPACKSFGPESVGTSPPPNLNLLSLLQIGSNTEAEQAMTSMISMTWVSLIRRTA